MRVTSLKVIPDIDDGVAMDIRTASGCEFSVVGLLKIVLPFLLDYRMFCEIVGYLCEEGLDSALSVEQELRVPEGV